MSQQSEAIEPSYSGIPPLTTREIASYIRELKLEVIVQAGRLEFAEADAKIRLAHIRLQQAENEKLAAKVSQIETRLDMFVLEQDAKGK